MAIKNITLKKFIYLILILLLTLMLWFINFYFLGGFITFSLIYLIPISLAVWFMNLSFGIVISLISMISWATVGIIKDNEFNNTLLFSATFIIKFGVYIYIVIVLNKLKISLSNAKKASRIDYLTNVVNRKALFEILNLELYKIKRNNNPLTIAYIDVDDFKQVNDNFGHKAGDKLLMKLSRIVYKNIRKTDTIARLGGDEFVIILPETDYETAKIVIEKVRKMISIMMKRNKWNTSLSIGVGTFYNNHYNSGNIINLVDNLMYKVKKNKKNNVLYKIYK